MRFLAGMCAGVMLLLYLAGDPGGHLARGAELAVEALPERARAADAADAREPPVTAEGAADAGEAIGSAEVAEVVAAVAEVAETVVWPEDEPLPEAFGEDFAWWGPPEAESEATPESPRTDAEAEPLVATAPAGAEPAPPVLAEATPPAPGQVSVPAPEEASSTATASVWIPFHSERSATGFAQRLSRALEHPFDVRREGPGRYQVVFPYADAAARDEVLARVAMITGTQP